MPDLSLATLQQIGEELRRREGLVFVLLAEKQQFAEDETPAEVLASYFSSDLQKDGLRLVQFMLNTIDAVLCRTRGQKQYQEE